MENVIKQLDRPVELPHFEHCMQFCHGPVQNRFSQTREDIQRGDGKIKGTDPTRRAVVLI